MGCCHEGETGAEYRDVHIHDYEACYLLLDNCYSFKLNFCLFQY